MSLLYCLTHPVQYQVPLVRHLIDGGVDIEVVYRTLGAVEGYFDHGFNQEIVWDVPLLAGYPYTSLPSNLGFRSTLQYFNQAFQDRKPQATWIHGWGSAYARAAWLAARHLRIPVLMRGDSQLAAFKGSSLKRILHRWVFSRLFRTVSHFLAVGSANKAFYLHYGVPEDRITTMPYAVDNQFFRQRAMDSSARRQDFRDA